MIYVRPSQEQQRPLGRQISSGTQLTFIRRDEGEREIVRKQLYDSATTIDDRARRRPLYYCSIRKTRSS